MTEYVITDETGTEYARLDDKAEAYAERNRFEKSSDNRTHFGVTEENSAEDNDDQTSMNYEFFTNGGAESQNNTDNNPFDFDWGSREHTTATDGEMNALNKAITETMGELDSDVDEDMMDVLADAGELVSNIEVVDFECHHPKCGLGHGHSETKHNITDSPDCSGISGFNITGDFARKMDFLANCHCGANEAAMLVRFYPYFDIPMFKDEERFEKVEEVDPALLEKLYRRYEQSDLGFSRLCARVAAETDYAESEAFPLGVREDLKAFFERREQIETQANKAPIGEETRSAIAENRKDLEGVLTL